MAFDYSHYQPLAGLLAERVILITGAGQGLGAEVAKHCAAYGATVILLGRKTRMLEAVYDDIVAAGHAEPLIFPMDLAKATEQDYLHLAEGLYQQLGRLDGILHNAAQFDTLTPLQRQTQQGMEQMLRVNLTAPFALTKACLPLLQRATDASVVYTASSAAEAPSAYWGSHAVSKHAAHFMWQLWAQELENQPQLRLNTLIPGPVQSPQRRRSHPGEKHAALPAASALLPLYLYLLGPDSAGVSGQTFHGKAAS